MKDKAFLDTNVLVYLYSSNEIDKKKVAISAINNYECITSTQALNEFSNVLLKKWKSSIEDIKNAIDEISSCCNVVLVDIEVIYRALYINERYGFSYFDSLMLSSSLMNGCKFILSEDMNHGQVIDGKLEIVNIFSNS